MPIPDPEPGLVVRYDYLWARQSKRGGYGKERPACLVASITPPNQPAFVVLLPITHARPGADVAAVEIPATVRHRLGLDDAPSWIVVSEYNVDSWPSAGLASLPGNPAVFSYGFIPPRLFAHVREKFLKLAEKGAKAVDRR